MSQWRLRLGILALPHGPGPILNERVLSHTHLGLSMWRSPLILQCYR